MRRGMSLLELLVVIGIIAILLGLLLPGVQKVRNSADRMRCQSNLRQIGLALHNCHDTVGVFPSGSQGLMGEFRHVGWQVYLLPYIEQDSIWATVRIAFATSPDPFLDPPHVGIGTVINVFLCPADPRVRIRHEFPYPNFKTGEMGSHPAAFSSYLGVSGQSRQNHDGMMFIRSMTTIAAVTDGTSNTLFLGERPPSADMRFGWWYAGTGDDGLGTVEFFLGVRELRGPRQSAQRCSAGPHRFIPQQFQEPCAYLNFWSPHPNGAWFLFVDGGARWLSYDADQFLPALASRASGEISHIDH